MGYQRTLLKQSWSRPLNKPGRVTRAEDWRRVLTTASHVQACSAFSWSSSGELPTSCFWKSENAISIPCWGPQPHSFPLLLHINPRQSCHPSSLAPTQPILIKLIVKVFHSRELCHRDAFGNQLWCWQECQIPSWMVGWSNGRALLLILLGMRRSIEEGSVNSRCALYIHWSKPDMFSIGSVLKGMFKTRNSWWVQMCVGVLNIKHRLCIFAKIRAVFHVV